MTFEEILNQAMALLQRQGRVSYRALKRQFDLDEAYVEDLKLELIEVHQVAVDQDNTMLVWVGGAAAPPPAAADAVSVQARALDAAPLTYTPPHLTDKILAQRVVVVYARSGLGKTSLLKAGVAPRTAQAAMRHSDIKLTMQVYTDVQQLDESEALASLPELPLQQRTDPDDAAS